MASPGLTLDTLFGDASPTGITALASWLYTSDVWAWVLSAFTVGAAIYVFGRGAWLAQKDPQHAGKRLDDEVTRVMWTMVITILLILPYLPPIAVKWVGINSSQPLPTIQVLLLGEANQASALADVTAQKLVSLHPFTAPSMPLLRAQADGYFAGAEEAVKIAQANVDATGGALSGADLNANLLHGAGAAYASAGLNNANTPPDKLQALLLANPSAGYRMQDAWERRPNMAMAECVGSTLLADTATALNNSQFSTSPDDRAITAATWDNYYQAASSYLVGAGGAAPPSPTGFGSAWGGGETVDVQLPPLSDILKGVGPRETVINATSFRQAYAPGVDPQELQQSPAAVAARLAGATDPQLKANLQRLLVAVKAGEAAKAADLQVRSRATAAYESLFSAVAVAAVQGADTTADFGAVLKNAQGPGAATLKELVSNNNLTGRCQSYGERVKTMALGPASVSTRYDLWIDRLSNPTGAAKMVGTGGWLNLGVYFLSTAAAYKDAFDAANSLREAAAESAGQHFSGDPVAIQATDANSAALAAGTGLMGAGAGLVMKGEKLAKSSSNAILNAGEKAASGGADLAKTVGKRFLIIGWLIDMAAIFRDFAPYLAFVVVAFWWYLRLAAFVLLSPAIVLVQAVRNFVALQVTPGDIADLGKRLVIFAGLPLVYVIGWAVIFFGTALIDILVAAMSGPTGTAETLKNLATLDGKQAAMSSGLVPVIIKFFLGLAIATVLFKIEGWLESFLAGHGTKDADMNTPSPQDLAK